MSGTGIAQDHLVTLISFLNMNVMNVPRLTIPNAMQQLDSDGKLALKASYPYLGKQVNAFLDFIAKQRLEEALSTGIIVGVSFGTHALDTTSCGSLEKLIDYLSVYFRVSSAKILTHFANSDTKVFVKTVIIWYNNVKL